MKRVFIIAEAGVNHNGSFKIAKQMVDAAYKSGVDAVKFQIFRAENLTIKSAKKAEYQKRLPFKKETQFEMLKKLELDKQAYEKLFRYCKKKGIIFLCSAFDLECIDFLKELGVKIFKIPSGEITNYPYLKKIGSFRKKIIMSTGMAVISEIRAAINVLVKAGTLKKHITLMHCTTEYPALLKDVNLLAIPALRKKFGVCIGYSDHTLGIEVPIAAVALGAEVIEKHFTLDKTMYGPDHKASLEPHELEAMVKAIRNIEISMGNSIKKPSLHEIKNKDAVRKSIVALRNIKKGDVFTENNITAKRPGIGINPMKWNKVIGKKALRDFQGDELIEV